MKKLLVFVLSLCLLLSGCSILSGDDSTPDSAPDSAPEGAYKALRCEAQDFSVLFDRGFSAVSSENGAVIFTGDKDALNKVELSVIYDGDTTGFDVDKYFHSRAEDMENEDGIKYTLSEEMTQSSAGNGVMSGAVYSFTTEDGTVYRYEMLVDTGTQLISYSCFFYEDEADEPILAMTDAIKSYQPSADYYDSHPLVIGGESAPTDYDSQSLVAAGEPAPTDYDSQSLVAAGEPAPADYDTKPQARASAPGTLGSYTVTKNAPLRLQTTRYNGGFFSLDLPKGWVIETTGEYTEFGFHAYDPNIPERQIFLYCKHEPLLKSMDAKREYQGLADLVGGQSTYRIWADAPVLLEPTTDYFFYIYNDYNSFINKYGLNHQLPVMNDISILEVYPNNTPTAFNTLDNSIVRASFYSANGAACEGLMAGQVVNTLTETSAIPGVDMGLYTVYNCNGVIAPEGEFNELREQLTACLASFNFTEEYVRRAQQNAAEETSAILAMSRQMQAAYDSYNAAWSARQTSYDIISQKNSDATLGYDRLYDPNTGETYRAELGFYDSYDINRNEYSNPNLQIIDGSAENYYLDGVDYYITD